MSGRCIGNQADMRTLVNTKTSEKSSWRSVNDKTHERHLGYTLVNIIYVYIYIYEPDTFRVYLPMVLYLQY